MMGHLQDFSSLHDPPGQAISLGMPNLVSYKLSAAHRTCHYCHVLHYLLPAKRDAEVTCRLRSMNKYPTVRAQTNRYKNSLQVTMKVS